MNTRERLLLARQSYQFAAGYAHLKITHSFNASVLVSSENVHNTYASNLNDVFT